MKICTKCKEKRNLENFHKTGKYLQSWCKSCQIELHRIWYLNNKEKANTYSKSWRLKNHDHAKKYDKEYYLQNKSKKIIYNRIYMAKRSSVDINYRMARNLRSRFSQAFKNGYKGGIAVRELGCPIGEFKLYIENQFQNGMSWDNYGLKGWHIDHIIPISHFDLENEMELKEACNWLNLQPMWGVDNISKGAKI